MAAQQQGLKNATRALVAAVGGGDAASGFCRYRQQQLSEVGSVNQPTKFMAADVILDLEAVTHGTPGHPVVTRYLARAAGFALVALPEVAPDVSARGDWLQLVSDLSKEAGDCVSKIALALTDGFVSPAEVRTHDLVREFDELIRVAVEGRARVLAAEAGE